jgi:CBS domain-containing protein
MTPLNIVAMMMQMGNINAMPVVNDNGELVGIIGDDDILKASMIEDRVEKSDMSTAHDEDAWAWEGVRDTLRLYYGVSEIKIPKIPVKEVMVKNVVTAYQYSEVSECARKMSRGNFDQLPVITSENVIIGVLKDRDLLKVFFE